MKIAIVCYHTFGGSGVVATELGLELAKRGHEIHFITYSQPVRLALLNPNVHYHEVHVPEYPLFHYQPYELALSSKLVDMVKLYKIDVLHVHYAIPHAYAGYMAKQMLADEGIHIPMVTTLHGTDITLVGNHPFYKPAVSFSINKSDVVTSVSQSLKDDTHRLFEIKKDIVVIPNFIELTKEKQVENIPCHRSLMAAENEMIVTHISNFRKVKRIDDIVKIFFEIQKEVPAKLMMVGEGPEKENAEYLCNQLTINLNLSIQRKFEDKYTIGDLWPGVLKHFKKSRISDVVVDIDKLLHIRNLLGAHYNEWAISLSNQDVYNFANLVNELYDKTF